MYNSQVGLTEKEEEMAGPLPEKDMCGLGEGVGEMVPPPYCGKSKLEMECYGGGNYWETELRHVEVQGTGEGSCECRENNKRKKSCFVFVGSVLALLLLMFVVYNVGKRSGFWRGVRFGKHMSDYEQRRGCRDEDGQWREREKSDDNRKDQGHGDGGDHSYGKGRSCNYKEEGRDKEERTDTCVRGNPRPYVEYDSGDVTGKKGSRLLQMMDDAKNVGHQILDYIDDKLDDTDVKKACYHILGNDTIPEVGDVFMNFTNFVMDMADRVSDGVEEQLPDVSSEEVTRLDFVREEFDDEDEEKEARDFVGDLCEEGVEMYKLVREKEENREECEEEVRMMLPADYNSKSDMEQKVIEMKLFSICIREKRGEELHNGSP